MVLVLSTAGGGRRVMTRIGWRARGRPMLRGRRRRDLWRTSQVLESSVRCLLDWMGSTVRSLVDQMRDGVVRVEDLEYLGLRDARVHYMRLCVLWLMLVVRWLRVLPLHWSLRGRARASALDEGQRAGTGASGVVEVDVRLVMVLRFTARPRIAHPVRLPFAPGRLAG